jgi:hypothetical protein
MTRRKKVKNKKFWCEVQIPSGKSFIDHNLQKQCLHQIHSIEYKDDYHPKNIYFRLVPASYYFDHLQNEKQTNKSKPAKTESNPKRGRKERRTKLTCVHSPTSNSHVPIIPLLEDKMCRSVLSLLFPFRLLVVPDGERDDEEDNIMFGFDFFCQFNRNAVQDVPRVILGVQLAVPIKIRSISD